MRAVVQSGVGGPETLRVGDIDDPVPGPDEVLIEVAAAGVNRADMLQREGQYPPPPGTVDVLGLEVSGTIATVGARVTSWRVGDPVCALLPGGGYAERVAVDAGLVMPVPDGVDVVDAAALPEVACTVYSNLIMTSRLRPGELVLIHGGSSGIGTHAIQIARAHGARVAVTARSDRKLAACRELGAEITVDYTAEDFVDTIGGMSGADVILDIIGAKYLRRNIESLATGGRLVIIGMQGGTSAELNIGALLSKRGTVAATNLRGRPLTGAEGKHEIVARTIESSWPLISDGLVKPVVAKVFPFTEAAEAHRYLDSGEAIGKILLTP